MGAVYTRLSLQDRGKNEDWWHAKVPVREIARVLKRHKSTVFREIKRNFWADDAFPKQYAGYFGHVAQLWTDKRRLMQRKLIRHPERSALPDLNRRNRASAKKWNDVPSCGIVARDFPA